VLGRCLDMGKAVPFVVAGLGMVLAAIFVGSVNGIAGQDPTPRAAVTIASDSLPSSTTSSVGLPTSAIPSGASATSHAGSTSANGTPTGTGTGTGKRQQGQPVPTPKLGRG
jgi:hypothetical protein